MLRSSAQIFNKNSAANGISAVKTRAPFNRLNTFVRDLSILEKNKSKNNFILGIPLSDHGFRDI